MENIYVNGQKNFCYCGKCTSRTGISACARRHVELHKGKENWDKTIYRCNMCSFENDKKTNYLNHILSDHSTKEERKFRFKYYCECCDFGVFAKYLMETHLNTTEHLYAYQNNP